MRLALLLLVVLGACRFRFDEVSAGSNDDANGGDSNGPPPPFDPYWRVGTRLKAVTLVPVGGGDPIWVGWWDTVMNTACQNALAADGAERCLPAQVGGNVFYADAGCTMPLGQVTQSLCLTGNTYATHYDASGHGHTYPLAGVHTGPVWDSRTGCQPGTPSTVETIYDLGAEVTPALWLDAQYHREQFGDYMRLFQGTVDGSSLQIGSLEMGNLTCSPVPRGLGPTRCQPTMFRGEAVYSNGGCTQRAYFWDRQSYDPASTSQFAVYDPQACETQYHLYSVTADITAASFWRLTPSGCQMQSMTADGRLYTATEIADTAPLGTLQPGPRRGRTGWLYWVGPDNSELIEMYYDHDLAIPCVPFVATDGKLRCLPYQWSQFKGSPDASCSGASRQLLTSCFGGVPYDGPTYVSCELNPGTVKTLPKIGTAASTYSEATCTPLTTPDGVYDPASPGSVVDPSMFTEMMEIIQ